MFKKKRRAKKYKNTALDPIPPLVPANCNYDAQNHRNVECCRALEKQVG